MPPIKKFIMYIPAELLPILPRYESTSTNFTADKICSRITSYIYQSVLYSYAQPDNI